MTGHNKRVYLVIKGGLLILAFSALILLSELIYTLKNKPEVLNTIVSQIPLYEKKYLEKFDYEKTDKKFLAPIYKTVTIEIFYNYLSRAGKNDFLPNECKPLCLAFDESQKLLTLFEKFDSDRTVSNLPPAKKSDLYFWMATISVWRDDDKKTLEYLVKASTLSDKNEQALTYKTEFQKLFEFESADIQNFFRQQLNSRQNSKQYEKIYMAKAAYKLGVMDVAKNDIQNALNDFNKAAELNPWNVLYHMSLSGTYLYLKNQGDAENVLKKCVEFIGPDAKDCRDRLASLQ